MAAPAMIFCILQLVLMHLRTAQSCAFNTAQTGTFSLSANCQLAGSKTLELSGGTLTITGTTSAQSPSDAPPSLSAHNQIIATGNGGDSGRHFHLKHPNQKLVASHVEFSGGKVNEYGGDCCGDQARHFDRQGGTIRVEGGSVEITSSVFAGCVGTCAEYGGIITLMGSSSSAMFKKCLFAAVTATNGGHMYIRNGAQVIVEDSVFQGGRVIGHGPSVMHRRGVATYRRVLFENNEQECSDCTSYTGGAITYIGKDTNSPMTVEDSTFRNNRNFNGGAIGLLNEDSGGTLIVKRTLFQNNNANSPANLKAGSGGAIDVRNHHNFQVTDLNHVSITDSTFISNTAGYQGGALRMSATPCMIDNVEFKHNVAGAQGGGAIEFDVRRSHEQKIYRSRFDSNYVTDNGNGGALVSTASTGLIQIVDSTFHNNKATSSESGDGGAIYLASSSGQVIMSGLNISSNECKNSGGGLYLHNVASININGTTIGHNTAGSEGGGVYFSGIIPSCQFNSTNLLANVVDTYSYSIPGWETRMFSAEQHPRSCSLPSPTFLKDTNPAKIGRASRIQHRLTNVDGEFMGCSSHFMNGNGMANACQNDPTIDCSKGHSPSSANWWTSNVRNQGNPITNCVQPLDCCHACCFDIDFDGDQDHTTSSWQDVAGVAQTNDKIFSGGEFVAQVC